MIILQSSLPCEIYTLFRHLQVTEARDMQEAEAFGGYADRKTKAKAVDSQVQSCLVVLLSYIRWRYYCTTTDFHSIIQACLPSQVHCIIQMETGRTDSPASSQPKWRKVAYGGMQPGFDDNHIDESFLAEMVMNANVVKRSMLKVMLDSVSISQYLCVVALVVLVWTYTLQSIISENLLLLLDVIVLGLGFLVLVSTAETLSFSLLLNYFLKISFFITALYVLSPIYHTLTRSISSDSIIALTASLIVLHLFLHNYSGSTVKALGALENPSFTSNISLNASIVASLLIASRLPSRLHVFAIVFFSVQVFLFVPLVTYCIKKYSFREKTQGNLIHKLKGKTRTLKQK
ncbi:hypothetical protein ACET3Z_001947 [Daucus carota]